MNSSELVAQIRVSGQFSDNDPTYTTSVLLAEATQACRDRFAEPLTTLRQGYGLQQYTEATSATNNFVRLPTRAVVQGLEKVEISIDSGQSYRILSIMTQTQANVFSPAHTGEPTHYTLEADTIRLFPYPATSAYLVRFTYYLRHPTLIAYDANVYVVSAGSNAIITVHDPTSVGISSTSQIDCQHPTGSSEISLVSAQVSSITGSGPYTINLSGSPDLSKIVAGDKIRVADQCVYPMMPIELRRPLADYTAAMIWISKGDNQKAAALSQKADAGIQRVVQMAQPRIKNSPFTFKRTNSYLRRSAGTRFGWR